MTESQLRKKAADLARDCRRFPLKGDWSRKAWNDQVRITIRHYIENTRRFLAANKES